MRRHACFFCQLTTLYTEDKEWICNAEMQKCRNGREFQLIEKTNRLTEKEYLIIGLLDYWRE